MDSPTFHSFPRLPAELRPYIWQQGCLPSQQYHRGLHYFNLNDQKKLIPESRAVVMKHSRLMEWKEFQEKASREG
ncbi:uncharacterized protein NECHADRAFT_29528, partial [Fusarium vanettenii 77-13-4]